MFPFQLNFTQLNQSSGEKNIHFLNDKRLLHSNISPIRMLTLGLCLRQHSGPQEYPPRHKEQHQGSTLFHNPIKNNKAINYMINQCFKF